jgi:hypothetical protein
MMDSLFMLIAFPSCDMGLYFHRWNVYSYGRDSFLV